MKTKITSVALLCVLFLFAACEKDEAIESDTPTIELVSVSSSSVQEGDPLSFRIQYTDGNGDLGENNSSVRNLFLTDSRVNVTYEYRISQLSPTNSDIIIRGNLDIVLNSTAITDNSTSQQVTYSIYVKDRAGNQSNTVTTDVVTIYR